MGVEVDYDVTGALLSPPTDIPQAILGGTISRLKRMPYGGPFWRYVGQFWRHFGEQLRFAILNYIFLAIFTVELLIKAPQGAGKGPLQNWGRGSWLRAPGI